jgi:hypothetical protein
MNGKNGLRGVIRMNMRGFGTRLAVPLGAVAVLAILVLGAGTAGASSGSPAPPNNVLATIPLVATVTANSTMVFAQGVTNCSEIWGITTSGTVAVYANVSTGTGVCQEGALTLSPHLICVPSTPGNVSYGPARDGNWGRGGNGGSGGCNPSPCHNHNSNSGSEVLYDVINGYLYEITEGGSNVTLITTFDVPQVKSENMGLTYDQVGDFDNDLIVTSSSNGAVWLVNATGVVTLLATLNTYIGGPSVAPSWFGPYAGDVLIAEKHLNNVVAISPSGNVSVVANWTTPNAVAFPATSGGYGQGWGNGCSGGYGGCSFGSNHDVFFVANYSSGAVEGFPASDFQNFTSQGFIAGGLNAGIGSFTSGGATTLFAGNTMRLSDAAFITCFGTSGCGGHGGCGGGGGGNGGGGHGGHGGGGW